MKIPVMMCIGSMDDVKGLTPISAEVNVIGAEAGRKLVEMLDTETELKWTYWDGSSSKVPQGWRCPQWMFVQECQSVNPNFSLSPSCTGPERG